MKPRAFQLLAGLDGEDFVEGEIRIFYDEYYVCIHGTHSPGYSFLSYGKLGRQKVVECHAGDKWTEVEYE